MSEVVELKASERDNTLNPRQLRAAGFIPATLYGKNVEPQSIQVKAHDFVLAYRNGAREFKLAGPGVNVEARAHQVQVSPVKQDVLNIEFLVPSATQEKKAPKKEKAAEAPKEEVAEQVNETVLAGA